jgi:hypothetical protein
MSTGDTVNDQIRWASIGVICLLIGVAVVSCFCGASGSEAEAADEENPDELKPFLTVEDEEEDGGGEEDAGGGDSSLGMFACGMCGCGRPSETEQVVE